MTERLEEVKVMHRDFLELDKKEEYQQADAILLELREKHMDWLIQQAELSVGLEHELEAADRQEEQWKELISTTMHWKSIYEKEAQRYKQALELVEDELEYAKTTGNDEVRDMYIKNSIRFINEALEREG